MQQDVQSQKPLPNNGGIISMEGMFKHPFSKEVITGVKVNQGMMLQKGIDFCYSRTGWQPCPERLHGTVFQGPNTRNGHNTLWVRTVRSEKEKMT